jgi:pimeloyl-ACP methyl ester carboxylesterase
MRLDHRAIASAFEPHLATQREWTRWCVDLPGTGESPATAPTSDAVLDAVVSSLDAVVRTQPNALAGYSYGGCLAHGLIRRLGERVAGAAFVCAGARIDPAARNLAGVDASTRRRRSTIGWRACRANCTRTCAPPWASSIRRWRCVNAALARRGALDEGFLDALASTGYRRSNENDVWRFSGPALVVTGRRDRIAGYADSLDLRGRYTDADCCVVARAALPAPRGTRGVRRAAARVAARHRGFGHEHRHAADVAPSSPQAPPRLSRGPKLAAATSASFAFMSGRE